MLYRPFIVKHRIISIASLLIYLNDRRAEHRMSVRRNEGKLSGSNLPYFSFKLSLLSHLRCVCTNACYSLFAIFHMPMFSHARGKSIAGQHFYPSTHFLSGPSLFYMLILFIITSVVGQGPRNCQRVSC